MSRPHAPKVVTANALLDGDVVYLAEDGHWSRRLSDARVLTDESSATQALAEATRRQGSVVGAYLADVRQGRHGPEPLHFREAFRAAGPSNYPHGKQSEV